VADPTVVARAKGASTPPAPPTGPTSAPGQPPSRPAEPGRPDQGGPGGPTKAAHRLPSGGYPAVDKAPSSMRPRGEPEPVAGDLFRPVDQPDQGRGGAPGPGGRLGQGGPTQDPTAMVRAAGPRRSAPARSADPPKTGQHGQGGQGGGPGGGPNRGPGGPQGQPKKGPGQPGGPGNGAEATVLASARPGDPKKGDQPPGRPEADKGERGPQGPDRAGRSPSASRSG
jgi:translation initiation factor IF-2